METNTNVCRNIYKHVKKEKKRKEKMIGMNTYVLFYNASPQFMALQQPSNRSPKYTRTFNPPIERKKNLEKKIKIREPSLPHFPYCK